MSPKGIGASTAAAIAAQDPALLILASRTKAKLEEVAADCRQLVKTGKVKTVLLDLASQKSIRETADQVKKLTDRIDILINNAALVVTSRQWTEDGLEMQWGTNHTGPFLFTNLLLPLLLNAAKTAAPGATRVVSLTSAGHRLSPIRFHDYNFEGKPIPAEEEPLSSLPPAFAKTTEDGYNGIIAYGQSKTANILFTLSLQKSLIKKGIAAYVLHPGSTYCMGRP